MQALDVSAGQRTAPDPPVWLLRSLVAAYLVGLAVLLFLPGGTLLDRLRALVGGICSQLPTHTYAPSGQPLPLCSRNTGIYLGFAIGVVALFLGGHGRSARLPSGWVACVLLLGVVVMGVDGLNSLFLDLHLPHLYQPANPLRLATGFLTGTAMAAYLVPVANGVLWRNPDGRAPYPTVASLAVLLPALSIGWLVVASQAGFWLYPVALISSAGVVLALTLINLTFVLVFGGRVARFVSYKQMAPMFTVAVSLALVELIGLSLLKQSLLQSMIA